MERKSRRKGNACRDKDKRQVESQVNGKTRYTGSQGMSCLMGMWLQIHLQWFPTNVLLVIGNRRPGVNSPLGSQAPDPRRGSFVSSLFPLHSSHTAKGPDFSQGFPAFGNRISHTTKETSDSILVPQSKACTPQWTQTASPLTELGLHGAE